MPTTITPQIVTVNAQVVSAPAASTLQQSGAFLSFGGTISAPNTTVYVNTLAGLEAILSSAGNYAELMKMGTTFFAQGGAIGVYVLELGGPTSTVTQQITALTTWINANPNVFYAYLVPAAWDAANSTTVNTAAGNYASATGKTYFFVTTSSANVGNYNNKAVFPVVPSPTAASTEFQAAAFFYEWLANNPGVASPAAPMNFRYLYGVTPWATTQNLSTITTILSAFGNLILTGAEGGISTSLIRNGTTSDGNQAMFWYAVDWICLQADLRLANAIINASNSNAPIVYNQFGINTLLAVLESMGTTSIAIGLNLAATFAAVPFTTYTTQNPSAYAAGTYGGFSATVTPQLGFNSITFYLTATTFA